jgi:hypothetical protein
MVRGNFVGDFVGAYADFGKSEHGSGKLRQPNNIEQP